VQKLCTKKSFLTYRVLLQTFGGCWWAPCRPSPITLI